MGHFALTNTDAAATSESISLAFTKHGDMKPFFYEVSRVHVTAEKNTVDDFCRTNPDWAAFEYVDVCLDPSEIRPKSAQKNLWQRLGLS
ncbi:MAG: hypothetical protein JWO78_932 [Micavibrio sp.]|nr:hypothetical protein [Micavibrio sp.]